MKLDELRRDWDALGRIDPMWAVLTHDDKRGGGWDAEEFFATGRREIAAVVEDLARLGLPGERGRALDFGCGVGRLTQALAEHFRRCDGVDIAPSMIDAARKLNRHGERVVYHLNDTDDLAAFPDASFDFVYSNIVLQHVGPAAAKAYIREFVRLLAPAGLALFQLPAENIREELRVRHRLPDGAFRARLAASLPTDARPGERIALRVTVANESAHAWPSDPPTDGTCRIRLGNHWFTSGGQPRAFDDGRTALPRTLGPGESIALTLEATAPSAPGSYLLVLDLVQEDIAWFESHGSPTLRGGVTVRGGLGARLRGLFGRDASAPAVTDATDTALTLRAGGEGAVMRMTGVPRADVVAEVEAAGGRVVATFDDSSSGREWRAFRYAVARR